MAQSLQIQQIHVFVFLSGLTTAGRHLCDLLRVQNQQKGTAEKRRYLDEFFLFQFRDNCVLGVGFNRLLLPIYSLT